MARFAPLQNFFDRLTVDFSMQYNSSKCLWVHLYFHLLLVDVCILYGITRCTKRYTTPEQSWIPFHYFKRDSRSNFLWHPVYGITGQNTDRAVIERLTRDDSIRVKRGPRFLHHLYSAQHHHRHLCIQLFAINFTIVIFNTIVFMFTTSPSSQLNVMFGDKHSW